MSEPGAAQLLEVWEQALELEPAARALAMLCAGLPGTDPAELAAWPLGRRDAALLQWRAELFGPDLAAIAQCPACGENVELSFSAASLGAGAAPGDTAAARDVSVHRGPYSLTLRAVTSSDLLSLAGPDPQPGIPGAEAGLNPEAELVRRCITGAASGGTPVEPSALPATVLAALGDELAAADPGATTELAADCPACGRGWLAPFHIASYLWAELHHWAGRMLLDIHTLARAYGWSEQDILALPQRRRQAYLDLVSP